MLKRMNTFTRIKPCLGNKRIGNCSTNFTKDGGASRTFGNGVWKYRKLDFSFINANSFVVKMFLDHVSSIYFSEG